MIARIIRSVLFVYLLTATHSVNAQAYTLSNEEVIFSFDTQNGKHVTVNKDKENKYLIYRFGTKQKVEFAFPNKTKESWKSFSYSFYMRGGGKQNEGMDLNYLVFMNNAFKYVIYDTYHAVRNKYAIGIRIINLTTNITTDIKGKFKTRKGTLIDFRDNGLVTIGDELFD
jgi:hypothetical protein